MPLRSSPYLQQPVTDNYSDPDESSSQPPSLLVEIQAVSCRAQILKVEAVWPKRRYLPVITSSYPGRYE